MRKLLLCAILASSTGAGADDLVRGYMRPDGTYVAPYLRTPPNGLQIDNYSGPGGMDPRTGAPRFPAPRLDYPTPQPMTADQILGSPQTPQQPLYQYPQAPRRRPLIAVPDDDEDDD